MELEILVSLLLFCVTLISFLFLATKNRSKTTTTSIPNSYPIIGSVFPIAANFHRLIQWISDILQTIPSSTFVLHRPFGSCSVITANPAVVQHILKTNFPCYHKGPTFHQYLVEFLGSGIFNTYCESWKVQRHISSHEFNTKSLRKFVETVVDVELNERLVPILSEASKNQTILPDFQDILQRFTFDNICIFSLLFPKSRL